MMETRSIRTIYSLAILAGVMLFGVSSVKGVVWTEGYHQINPGDVYGEVDIYNDVTLDIFGGDTARLAAFDTTYTNWYDGEMNTLWARDDSIVNIYGGTLDTLAASENSLVNLCAYDIVITHTGGFWDDGQVTGKYYVGDIPFIFDLWGQNTYLHINIIPEPSTLLLLSLGSIILIKRK
jgi:hypothetical protein